MHPLVQEGGEKEFLTIIVRPSLFFSCCVFRGSVLPTHCGLSMRESCHPSCRLVLSSAAPSAERQLGEQANELFGTQEVRWPHSRRFQVVFWDERAQV